MLTRKSLALCAGALTLLIIAGCGKKETEPDTSAFSDMPELNDLEETKDTADIFDEFYDSDADISEPAEQPEPAPIDQSYSSARSYSPEFVPGGPYVVQVSTIRSQGMAEDVARDLESKGYPSYLAEVQNPTPELSGTFYRVRLGGFNTISAAREFGNQALIPNGYEFWVDNRSNDNIGMGGYGLGQSASSDYSDSYAAEPQTSAGDSYTETPEPASGGNESDWGGEPAAAAPAAQPQETAESGDQAAGQQAQQPVSQPETPAPAEPEPTPAESSDDDWGEDDWGDDEW
jgi:hypothetical protein